MGQKRDYLILSIKKILLGKGMACPNCGSLKSKSVSRKYLVTSLKRCHSCQLQFRTPTTSSSENQAFYQKQYSQGITTEYPDQETLKDLKSVHFKGHEKDYQRFIDLIQALGGKPGMRLFDFGCSWGYGSWQFSQAGFDVESFEVSSPRAKYGRDNFNLTIHESQENLPDNFDFFFSSHVLEHVPKIKDSVQFGLDRLKPGGYFIAITPNGSHQYKNANPTHWQKLWGMVHPNFLDESFYQNLTKEKDSYFASNPMDLEKLSNWANSKKSGIHLEPLNDEELHFVCRK